MPRIEDLIPHRAGILLIENILSVDERHAETQATVKQGWPLSNLPGASALLLVELAAQTAGLSFGWSESKKPLESRSQAKGGWLVGVKKAQFFSADLSMGTHIITRTETVLMLEQYKEIFATAHWGESLLAQIHFQVLQSPGAP